MDVVKRPVTLGDSELILAWRNVSSARKVSRTSGELSETKHRDWFESRIDRLSSEPFWIMSLGGRDVGFVRLDLSGTNDDIFAISIFVEPEFRAVGVGKQMLSLALNSIDVDQDRYQFLAIIGRDNQGSIRLFKSFGFELCMRIDHQFDEYRMTANRKESSALGI